MNRRKFIFRKIYFGLMLLLAASLPLSVFACSFIQILLLINWIIEADYKNKFRRLFADKAFIIYAAFFIILLLGLAWSADLRYGLKVMQIKLSLLIIPFLIASSEEFSMKELRMILAAFIAGTVIASFASILALLNVIQVGINDFRNASLFISHIRFSLMVVLSIFFAVYLVFVRQEEESRYLRIFYILSAIWLPVFLIILKSLSGLVIIVILILFLAIQVVILIPDRALRFMLSVLIIFIPLFAIIYLGNAVNRFYSYEQLAPSDIDSLTIEGNEYINHINNEETENGNYVWIHVCPEELEREWAKVSSYPYMGMTENGDVLRFTLIRYLTSKGLRKDAVGIRQLSETDIHAIENGVANYIYLNRFALYPRIYEVIWEIDRYRLGHNANDKSLIQRYYYLKAGVNIASEHLLFGVGTGDVQQAFSSYYENVNTGLRIDRRRQAHNQYLTLVVAIGVFGLLVTILAFVVPLFIRKKWSSYMTVVFILTMALSMIDEDTLDTSTGVVMFGLFYGLFVFGKDWDWKKNLRI